jgi:outer membrane protein OmpA-like peptidoglycan-associated protein
MRFPAFLAPLLVFLAAPLGAQEPDGQPFRIFFDWSKPELTRDAEAILGEAVAAYQRVKPARVEVAGHSDRSGPVGVNIAASRKRANAAKAFLVAHGVPEAAISVAAFGESRPIVPTADGVREMQNRRVEIRFSR